MTEHDRAEWVALRRAVADGTAGGARDGTDRDARETSLFEVHCSCEHGETAFDVEVTSFTDLLLGMNVLSFRHQQAMQCTCSDSDEQIARTAVETWRKEYGSDPVIPYLGSES